MFFVFGDRNEAPGELTLTMKLPISVGMVQDLYFVRESTGWYRQHDWVIARFGPDDDIAAEIPTLKGVDDAVLLRHGAQAARASCA